MSDYITAVSSDGQGFMLFRDGTWKIDSTPKAHSVAYRSSAWGASVDEVKKSESAKLVLEEADFLAYQTSVANSEALALFTFVNGRLVSGRYSFQEPHANNQAYLHDFWKLKRLLEEKYGPSKVSDTFWVNELYRDNVDEWGMAVACGHVSFFETWNVEDTHIELQLTGDNYEVKVSIMYKSLSLKGLLEQAQRQQAISGL